MTKRELDTLEDLKTWGVSLTADLEAQHGARAVQTLLASGHIQVLESPLGEVFALAPAGYRHFEYAFQWYKPNASAMMDQLALRLVVRTMLERGYTGPEWRSRTAARVVSTSGTPTYLVVKYRAPLSSAVTKTVEKLIETGIESDAEIIVFREQGNRLKAVLTRTTHRVTVEAPPWTGVFPS
jgi:hypothetical protein